MTDGMRSRQLALLADPTPDTPRDDVERTPARTEAINARRRQTVPVDERGAVIARPEPRVWVMPRPIFFDDATITELQAAADRLVDCRLLPGCTRRADSWFDGTPACLDCVEAWLDRDAALWANPYLQLPELTAP